MAVGGSVTVLAYILGGEDAKSRPETVALTDQPALPTHSAQRTKQDSRILPAMIPARQLDRSSKTQAQLAPM